MFTGQQSTLNDFQADDATDVGAILPNEPCTIETVQERVQAYLEAAKITTAEVWDDQQAASSITALCEQVHFLSQPQKIDTILRGLSAAHPLCALALYEVTEERAWMKFPVTLEKKVRVSNGSDHWPA